MTKIRFLLLMLASVLILGGCGENNNQSGEGTVKWKLDTNCNLYSAPAIAQDGTIYIAVPLAPGQLWAINPNDGSVLWKTNTNLDLASSPTIGSDGTIYLGGNAYDSTGRLKWSYPTGEISYSAAAISKNGTVYVGSVDKNLYALNSDGTLKWKFQATAEIDSSPAIGGDGTIYFLSRNAFYAVYPNGTQRWRIDIGYYSSERLRTSPAIDSDGTIYCSDCAVNPNGTIKWGGFGVNNSSPVIGNDSIYVGSINGRLYSLNKSNGTVNWYYETSEIVISSAAVGSDGIFILVQTDSML